MCVIPRSEQAKLFAVMSGVNGGVTLSIIAMTLQKD